MPRTTTITTGETPVALFLAAKPGDKANGFIAQRFGWDGCLDAIEMIPAGSVKPANIRQFDGQVKYEGNVISWHIRG